MLKTGLLAGALLAGLSVPALAGPPQLPGGEPGLGSPGVGSPGVGSAAVQGCLGETQDWLPGALQLDQRAATLPGAAVAPEAQRAPAKPDCALV